MYCRYCGTQNVEGSSYCIKCGKRLFTKSGSEIIRLRCTNCEGIMDIDAEKQIISCPYCGSKSLILESDDVKIEKIRAKTEEYKQDKQNELSRQQLEYLKEQDKRRSIEDSAREFRRSKLCKFLIGFAVFIGLCAAGAFSTDDSLSGLVGSIQVIILVLSIVSGATGAVFKGNPLVTYGLAAIGILLTIPFLMTM